MARADVAARSLADEYGLTALPVDPEKVATSLGAIVIRQPTTVELSGMLMRRHGTIAMGINSEMEPARQRFALAHLVGHLHLHRRRELILDTIARHDHPNLLSMPTEREEAEANRFASALLAPDAAVRRAALEADFRTASQLVDLLAPRFGLTPAVMGARLMGLGIILDV